MRPPREALVFKALCVLDEACDEARHGRVPPTLGLRFALAFLYAAGDRRAEYFDREPYDTFWRVATIADAAGTGVQQGAEAYGRQITMQAAMNGMARAAGLEMTPPVMASITAARRSCRQAPPRS